MYDRVVKWIQQQGLQISANVRIGVTMSRFILLLQKNLLSVAVSLWGMLADTRDSLWGSWQTAACVEVQKCLQCVQYIRFILSCSLKAITALYYRSLMKFLRKAMSGEPVPATLRFLSESARVSPELRSATKFNLALYQQAFKLNALRYLLRTFCVDSFIEQ